jgi:hypothetical protein
MILSTTRVIDGRLMYMLRLRGDELKFVTFLDGDNR